MPHMHNHSAESALRPSPADLAEQVVDAALKAGADAAEAVFGESRSLSIGVRKGAVETIESDETTDLGLRVFVGQRQAVVSVSEFSQRTLDRLVERCVAMAKIAPEDIYAGLADKALLYTPQDVELDIFDPVELDAETLKARALETEAAAVALSPALQSDSASAGRVQSNWLIHTSDGFSAAQTSSLFFQSARLIATADDGAMERDGEGRSVRYYADLPAPEETGRIAAERTLKALGARKIASQKAPVIFDARVARSLIGLFFGAISGPAVARGSSYLKDRLGQAVFASGVNIVDEPWRVRGLGSTLYDDEGVAAVPRHLIEDGVLTTWLLNTAAARQLGLKSTGHASRSLAHPAGVSAHNAVLQSGTRGVAEAQKAAGKGVLITSMFGPSVNNDTGDWSAGASGFWFENGEIQHPVSELTVAGNLIDIFARLEPLSDLEIRGTLDTPSIFVEGLSLGGK